MAAMLPENLEEHTLADMLPGECVYTVPWGMWVDRDRLCWLHPDYSTHTVSGGTAAMLVRRLEDGTYEVDLRNVDHRWKPADSPGYAGSPRSDWLRVSNLVT